MARRSADAVHAYLADCFLSECFLSDRVLGDGPLCAIDLDGVLETDRLGYPASGPEGAMALRGLVAHGYRPVLATGRSMVDARDRCTVFGLAGAVAEYGTVVYEHRQRATTDLRTPSEQDLVERVRETLDAKGLEVDPGHRYAVRVRLDDGPVSPELLGTIPLLGDPRLQVIHGQGQSDVALRRLDKAAGVRALAERLGASRLALAVGDSAADLPMLQMAELPRAPRNAQARLAAAGIPVTRGAYQAGLLEACGALIGHRPGGCPVCRIPPFPLRTRALLAVLALPGNGIEALPVRTARLTLAVARMLRDSTDG
jgi:hydroxymethylpyrimidine pyrophosphatase-like HAD family hydrolase